MKSPRTPLHLRFVSTVLTAGIFGTSVWASLPEREQQGVVLSESEGESECVMVFAKVGERFHFDLLPESLEGRVTIEAGDDATGEPSSLPHGIVLDDLGLALEGIPQKAGFHEFVIRESVAGHIQERVVLIDIQGHSFGAGSMDYASYFAGGAR